MQDAIRLSKFGLRVMPIHSIMWTEDGMACTCKDKRCESVGKHPILGGWRSIAENDHNTLTAWQRKFHWANLGVITGKVSGVLVLDIDPKNGGNESLKEITERFGELPETPTVTTGSGGSHYYFRMPGFDVGNRASIFSDLLGRASGIDIRGTGGQAVAPQSKHISGERYVWEIEPEDAPFADIPPWLLRELNAPQKARRSYGEITESGIVVGSGGRDNFLMGIAGGLRRKGLGYKPIMACIWYTNLEHCDPPLDADSVRRIARSACSYDPGDNRK